MKFKFDDRINGNELLIGNKFKTPILNGAFFHQTTLNDFLGAKGLSVTVGLRVDYEKMFLKYDAGYDLSHTYSLNGVLSPMNKEIQMVKATTFNAAQRYEGKTDHNYLQLLPKFAMQYNFGKRNNVYASVTRGYRSGGFNIQSFSELLNSDMQSTMMTQVAEATIPVVDNAPMIPEATKALIKGVLNNMKSKAVETDVKKQTLYKPEYSWNYEIGSHLNLADSKLQLDLAAFYMDTHDQQISRFSDTGLGRETVNAGKSKSMGAEATLKTQITNDFSLNGCYGYTYATFSNGENEGNYVPFVPKHTFNAGAQYVIRTNACRLLDNITINANYKAAGRIYWTEQNNASQALYGTLNGRISLNKGHGQISIWANNILNKDYQAFYFETMGRGFTQQGRPIQAGIDIRCCF